MPSKRVQEFLNYNNLNFGPIGSKKPIEVDISSSDYVVTDDIRLITCIGGTVIKVDMLCSDGEVSGISLPSMGGTIPVINITKIYKTGTDVTNILLWPLELGI